MAGEPILVVDDAAVNLNFMRLVLAHEGYAVRTAHRAEAAMEMLESFHPQLILTDIKLPGMDGLDMTRRIKNNPRTNSIKVLALTASVAAGERELALGAGCDACLNKPVDTATLASRIRELLDEPALEPPPALPSKPEDGFGGMCGVELEQLRNSFLSEGTEKTRHFLETLDHHFDAAAAARVLHSWVGTGGLLGCPEISKLARANEEMLRMGGFSHFDLRQSLSALALTFDELRAANLVAIPDHVAAPLRGKRIALIGFTPDRADFLCSALERVRALPRLFDVTDSPATQTIAECDLVMVHVRPETLDCAWLSPSSTLPPTPLLLAGDRRDLLNLPPAVQARELEFLVDTWHPEEVLMRLHKALARRHAAPPAPAPSEAVPQAPARAAGIRPTVVIADDDNLILTVVGSTLQNYGMECSQAANGEDALRLIREQRPQLAVLDVNMPGLDGYEVLAAIRAENLPVLVVLLTARQREGDILRGFQLGADDYLIKPFNPLELVARLKRLIRR